MEFVLPATQQVAAIKNRIMPPLENKLMKTFIQCICSIGVMVLTIGAQDARVRIGESRNQGTGQLFITPMPGQVPRSLKSLCDASALIVDATVQATLPTRETSPGSLETDAVVIVSDTLKGSGVVRSLVIAQRGGSRNGHSSVPAQYSLLQPTERYILFLQEDRRMTAPEVPGSRRYLVTGIWSGLFRFEGNRMTVVTTTPDSLRKIYQGLTIEQVTSEVKRVLLE